MPSVKKIPVRMCIACREPIEKKKMLRIVKTGAGEIFVDFSGKASGRGAYICGKAECAAKLRKQKLLNKAFSCDIPAEIYDRIEEELSIAKQN